MKNKIVVVTGGAAGIGKATAVRFAEAGAKVVICDVNKEAGEAVAMSLGPDARFYEVDVANRGAVQAFIEDVVARYGRVDVLVNNAAMNDRVEAPSMDAESARFERYPLAEWRRMMDVNVTGVFLPSQILGREMAARGSGSIVNVASTYALVGPDPSLYARPDGSVGHSKSPAYPASKGAVLAFTRFLAAHWGAAGVRVNALVPGGVENGQDAHFIASYSRRTPLARMAAPDEMGGALVFLASDASRYMTGATLDVDGGFTAW